MTISFFCRPVKLLSIIFLVSFVTFSCAWAQSDKKGEKMVGGPCQYKSYPGQATILSIAPNETSGKDRRFEVRFSFAPQKKIEEKFAQVEGKAFNLYGNNFQLPDADFVNLNRLQVGKILDGNLQVITSGTCTPVLFDFPSLKQQR